jgi:hypothetical protein
MRAGLVQHIRPEIFRAYEAFVLRQWHKAVGPSSLAVCSSLKAEATGHCFSSTLSLEINRAIPDISVMAVHLSRFERNRFDCSFFTTGAKKMNRKA